MISKNSNGLRCAFFSDVHLGHPKTPTPHTIAALDTLIIKNPEARKLDLIVIAGDLFDKGLQYTDSSVSNIQVWALRFLGFCAVNNIVVRMLEGTPLHDRKQSANLIDLCKGAGFNLDIKYVDTLQIEHLDSLDIDLLYIPDEWRSDPNETWLEVKEKLAEHHLDQVDLAIMHGMMPHQLPPGVKLEPHDNRRYESIVKYYVVIGHIHQPSFRGKVIAPGSTNRLTHGDEGKKGLWYVTLNEDPRLNEVVFKENKDALPYLTISCGGLGFDAAIEKITQQCNDLPIGSNVRLRVRGGDPTAALVEWGRKQYTGYNWTSQRKDVEKDASNVNAVVVKHKTTALTPNTIPSLVEEKLKNMTADLVLQKRAMAILNKRIGPVVKDEGDDVRI